MHVPLFCCFRYGERFDKCHKHLKAIVVHLLALDPSKRKSARDALTHPFFAGVTAASRSPLRVAKDAAFHEWKTKEVSGRR